MPKAKKQTNANKRKNDAKSRLDSTKKKKSAPVLSEKPKIVAEKLPIDAIAANPQQDDPVASAALLIDASATDPKDDATAILG